MEMRLTFLIDVGSKLPDLNKAKQARELTSRGHQPQSAGMPSNTHFDFREKRWQFLMYSIILDIVGCMTFGLPFAGELLDVVWAPISAYLLKTMYKDRAMSKFQFWKEILPFTDIIPVATLNWFVEFTSIGQAFARRFGLNKRRAGS